MLISLGLLTLALTLLVLGLQHQTGRNIGRGLIAWIFNLGTGTATVVLAYLAWAVLMLAIMSGVVFFGLAFNWPWLIYVGLGLVGILLFVVTYLVELPLNTLAVILAGLRKAALDGINALKIDIKATPETVDTTSIEALVAALPADVQTKIRPHLGKAQKWLNWALSVFGKAVDPAVIRSLGTSIIRATLVNAEDMVRTALSNISAIKTALLWFFIVMFLTMFIPEQATGHWLLPLGLAIALLFLIANKKGQAWRDKHNLGDPYWTAFRLIKYGAWACVIAIAWLAITPIGQMYAPHILVAIHVKGPQAEEQLAKEWFGQDFDQAMCRVVKPVRSIVRQGTNFVWADIVFPGMVLWRVDPDSIFTPGSVRYGKFRRQVPTGLAEPGDEILAPENAVCAIRELPTRTARVDSGVVCYPDSLGRAARRQIVTPTRYDEFHVTAIQTQIYGSLSNLCMVRENDKTKWVWVKTKDLHFTS